MPYIGRNTDKLSNVEVLDNITFDGSQSYTLQKNSVNFSPSSANTILISIDGVVQAGNFTVSGSTIDFGVAVASSSTCDFILHYGVGLITTPADGTITDAKLAASAINSQTAETSIAGGDEVLIYDTSASALRKMTRTNFVSGIGGTNTPYFSAYLSSTQSGLNDDAITKINLNAEYADSDSAFDSTTNYRFTVPTGKGGEYFLTAKFNGSTQADQDNKDTQVYIYKNGSSIARGRGLLTDSSSDVTQVEANASIITTLAAGDYIELYGRVNSSGNNNNNQAIANGFTVLSGYKLIE